MELNDIAQVAIGGQVVFVTIRGFIAGGYIARRADGSSELFEFPESAVVARFVYG